MNKSSPSLSLRRYIIFCYFKLLDAGLRELKEEVGLSVTCQDCVDEKIDLLALWEVRRLTFQLLMKI